MRSANSTVAVSLTNDEIAAKLLEVAVLLLRQRANPFRTAAYISAARVVRALPKTATELLQSEGTRGLLQLPGIGQSLARSIEELAHTGRLALLDRLHGEERSEDWLSTLPGIGPALAERIQQQLASGTPDELLSAAYDGRLRTVPGLGDKRLRAIRESLTARLGQAARQRKAARHAASIADLLDIDRQYRDLAARDRLPRIAPRQFNPTGRAWLPVLHTQRGNRQFTAMFSNSEHAHRQCATQDWVVIFRDDARGYGHWTVISSRFGPLAGQRIVRGREAECEQHNAGERRQQALPLATEQAPGSRSTNANPGDQPSLACLPGQTADRSSTLPG